MRKANDEISFDNVSLANVAHDLRRPDAGRQSDIPRLFREVCQT